MSELLRHARYVVSETDKWAPLARRVVQPLARCGAERWPGPPVPRAPRALPLICYEAIFPGDLAGRDERPGWIINLTNDGWFGISTGPYQHMEQARMRAWLETRVDGGPDLGIRDALVFEYQPYDPAGAMGASERYLAAHARPLEDLLEHHGGRERRQGEHQHGRRPVTHGRRQQQERQDDAGGDHRCAQDAARLGERPPAPGDHRAEA